MSTVTSALRILVVDDNRDAADLLAMLLGLSCHQVRVAYNGEAGLKMAREWVPDCVVSDIAMPHLDGYGLARAIRSDPALAVVKLIAISGFASADHATKAAAAGFDHQLTKGDDPAFLMEILAPIA